MKKIIIALYASAIFLLHKNTFTGDYDGIRISIYPGFKKKLSKLNNNFMVEANSFIKEKTNDKKLDFPESIQTNLSIDQITTLLKNIIEDIDFYDNVKKTYKEIKGDNEDLNNQLQVFQETKKILDAENTKLQEEIKKLKEQRNNNQNFEQHTEENINKNTNTENEELSKLQEENNQLKEEIEELKKKLKTKTEEHLGEDKEQNTKLQEENTKLTEKVESLKEELQTSTNKKPVANQSQSQKSNTSRAFGYQHAISLLVGLGVGYLGKEQIKKLGNQIVKYAVPRPR